MDLAAEIAARADEDRVSSLYKFRLRNLEGTPLVVNVSIAPLAGKSGERDEVARGDPEIDSNENDEHGSPDGAGQLLRDVHNAGAEPGVAVRDLGHADLEQRHEGGTGARARHQECALHPD